MTRLFRNGTTRRGWLRAALTLMVARMLPARGEAPNQPPAEVAGTPGDPPASGNGRPTRWIGHM